MNIQRDINPENDKKLNKMLDAKFGKQTMTIATGNDVRKMKAILKSLEVIKAELEKQQDEDEDETVDKIARKPRKPSAVSRAVARRITSPARAAARGMAGVARGAGAAVTALHGVARRSVQGRARRGEFGTGGAKDPVRVPKRILSATRRATSAGRRMAVSARRMRAAQRRMDAR